MSLVHRKFGETVGALAKDSRFINYAKNITLRSVFDSAIFGNGSVNCLADLTFTSNTVNGLTITNNHDGTISLNGTSSPIYGSSIYLNGYTYYPGGTYKILGLPKGVNGAIQLWKDNGTDEGTLALTSATNGGVGTIESGYYRSRVYIQGGQTIVSAYVCPMLTKNTSLTYDDFVPSVPHSLKEVGNLVDDVVSDMWTPRTYAVGEYAIYDNKLWKCKVANNVAPSEGANWTCVKITSEFSDLNDTIEKKMWENSNMSVSFDAQTVTIDLSDFDYIDVVFKGATTGTVHTTTRLIKNVKMICTLYVTAQSYRIATMQNNGVVFENGFNINSSGTPTQSNNLMIPYMIFAGKFKK